MQTGRSSMYIHLMKVRRVCEFHRVQLVVVEASQRKPSLAPTRAGAGAGSPIGVEVFLR